MSLTRAALLVVFSASAGGCAGKVADRHEAPAPLGVGAADFTAPPAFKPEVPRQRVGYLSVVPSAPSELPGEALEALRPIVIEGDRVPPELLEEKDGWSPLVSEGLIRVVIEGRYGYVTEDGHVVIPPRFDMGSEFNEGRALVMAGGTFGFIDPDGSYAIGRRFEWAFPFYSGKAAVKANGRWGIIDSRGRWVVEPTYFLLMPRGEGFWAQTVSGERVVIDEDGNTTRATRAAWNLALVGSVGADDSGSAGHDRASNGPVNAPP